MSLKSTFKLVLGFVCLLLQFNLQAMTIHVSTAGSLPDSITVGKDTITSLTLTGDLNGTDILFIREMAGSDVNGDSTAGRLANLDLSGANIVAGGATYYHASYSYYHTSNSISTYMFYNCNQLTQVVLPPNVTTIGEIAFWGCTGLPSITIPNSVTTIGGFAFKDCTGLSSIIIPTGVTEIGDDAFIGCTDLTEINVASGNMDYSSIDGVLFNMNKTQLITYPFGKSGDYTIPNSVTTIGNSAFKGCKGLTGVTIPNSVQQIEVLAFEHCTGLLSITIPTGVTEIEELAFANCTDLTEINVALGNINYSSTDGVLFNKDKTQLITYPVGKSGAYTILNGVTTIGDNAFYTCEGLTSLTIPNSVTEIGDNTFWYCTDLTEMNVALGNINYSSTDGVLFNKDKTQLITYPVGKSGAYTIPNGVTTIGDYAFYTCEGLTSLTIPNSVTTIGEDAFFSCTGLTGVTIPNSVIELGVWAFARCTGLTEIHGRNTTPPACDGYCFYGVDTETCILYVPAGSSAAYRVAPEWRDFNIVVEEGSTTAINAVESDASSVVFTREGGIRVELTESMPIAVYTASGQRVYASVLQGGSAEIDLDNGIYIVRLGNRSSKVLVK